MPIKQSKADIDEIESVTLGHYESNAESYWLGTRDHDVSQNINAFLQALPTDDALDILDLGCGPGEIYWFLNSEGTGPRV